MKRPNDGDDGDDDYRGDDDDEDEGGDLGVSVGMKVKGYVEVH